MVRDGDLGCSWMEVWWESRIGYRGHRMQVERVIYLADDVETGYYCAKGLHGREDGNAELGAIRRYWKIDCWW